MILIAIVVVIAIMLVIAAVFITTQSLENGSPTAVIDSPGNDLDFSEDTEIEFDASSSSDPDEDDLIYYWNSNISGDIGQDVKFNTKLEPGFHEIELMVIDENSAQNSIVINIAVYPCPYTEISSPTDNQEYYTSELIVFNGSCCCSSYSPNLNFRWSSSLDGMLGFDEIISTELTAGSHKITLEVDDGLGTAQEQVMINIETNEFPTAKIKSPIYDETFLIDTDIYFDGSSSNDPDDHDLYFNWTSNLDGKIGDQETFFTNLSAGTHIIELEVNDGVGGVDETSIAVSVNSPPIADAGLNRSALTGEQLTFDASGSYDPDGDSLTYLWDFGDGNKNMGKSITHTYIEEGNYTVTLTVHDDKGGVDIDIIIVDVTYAFFGTGVFGYVYDNETLKPLEDVRVYVGGWDYANDDYFSDSTRTNIFGYYEFHTPAGEFYVDAYLNNNYYDYDEDITISENQGVELDIYLIRVPPETSKIFGYVYDNLTKEPLEDADIDVDNDDGYRNWTDTDENGYYEVNAPFGEFFIECGARAPEGDIDFETYYTKIYLDVEEELRLDIYLKREVPDDINITFDFSLTWDDLTMSRKVTEYSDTYYTRRMMDNDDDGEVTESEVSSYETYREWMYDYDMEDETTEDYFLVDDIEYLYIQDSVQVDVEGAEGPTTSTTPITTTVTFRFESNQSIPISDVHEIKIYAHYDYSYSNYTYNIILPTFFEMTNYTATKGVNVTGKNEIRLEPYHDPNPDDGYSSEWVIIDVERTI
jgi:hypothetical protein